MNAPRNVLYLDVEFRRIQKMLRESWPQRVERDAQQASKDSRGNALRESYAKRREPDTSGPGRAA